MMLGLPWSCLVPIISSEGVESGLTALEGEVKYMNCQGDQNWVVILSWFLPSSAFTLVVPTLFSAEAFQGLSVQGHKIQADQKTFGDLWIRCTGSRWYSTDNQKKYLVYAHPALQSWWTGTCVFWKLLNTHRGNTNHTCTSWHLFPFPPLW